MKNSFRFAVTTAMLFVFACVIPAQETQPLPGFVSNGGKTPSGRVYDYRKVEVDKTTYLKVLRTREEIDKYLHEQALAQTDPAEKQKAMEFSQRKWSVMTTPWRTDPVTSEPIGQMPPNPKQIAELFKAIDERLSISPEAKEEFKKKLPEARCIERPLLDPPRFVTMVNGTGINEKMEIPEALAKQTKTCEFFLESEPIVISLVFVCGNFGFVFTDVWWVNVPVVDKPKEQPTSAKCVKIIPDSGLKLTLSGEVEIHAGEKAGFTALLEEGSAVLQLKRLWRVDGMPRIGGRDYFVFEPAMVDYQAERKYKVDFVLEDQLGNVSVCPSIVVSLVRVPVFAPPSTTSISPPSESKTVPPKEPGKPCKIGPVPCWGVVALLAGIGGGTYAATRGDKDPRTPLVGVIKPGNPAVGVASVGNGWFSIGISVGIGARR